MYSLLLLATLASSAGIISQPAENAVSCTAERLRHFVSPDGVRQPWPIAAKLPAGLENDPGVLLSDQGNFDDGYSHWLVVDQHAAAAYVVQRGGYAGLQTVYGPLPVAVCSQVPPNNSFKPKPLRGSA
jgi:hypothetical protein